MLERMQYVPVLLTSYFKHVIIVNLAGCSGPIQGLLT